MLCFKTRFSSADSIRYCASQRNFRLLCWEMRMKIFSERNFPFSGRGVWRKKKFSRSEIVELDTVGVCAPDETMCFYSLFHIWVKLKKLLLILWDLRESYRELNSRNLWNFSWLLRVDERNFFLLHFLTEKELLLITVHENIAECTQALLFLLFFSNFFSYFW